MSFFPLFCKTLRVEDKQSSIFQKASSLQILYCFFSLKNECFFLTFVYIFLLIFQSRVGSLSNTQKRKLMVKISKHNSGQLLCACVSSSTHWLSGTLQCRYTKILPQSSSSCDVYHTCGALCRISNYPISSLS